MSKTLKNLLQFVLFLGLGLAILVWIFRKQQDAYTLYCQTKAIPKDQCSLWDKLWTDLVNVNWVFIALIFVAFVMSNISRALRWQMVLKSLGYGTRFLNALGAVFIAYFANLGIPRSGEVFRAAVLSKYEKISFDKSFGTIVSDRIIDMSSMIVLVFLSVVLQKQVFLQFYENKMKQGIEGLVEKIWLLGILAIGVLIAAIIFRKKWTQWTFVKSINEKLKGFYSGILAIGKLERPWLYLIHVALVWFWYFMMLFFAMKSFGPTSGIGMSEALLIYVISAMGMLVPTPGGMGSYHYLLILALSYYGIQEIDAFSFANIAFFSAQFATNILLGVTALIYLPVINTNYEPNRSEY